MENGGKGFDHLNVSGTIPAFFRLKLGSKFRWGGNWFREITKDLFSTTDWIEQLYNIFRWG